MNVHDFAAVSVGAFIGVLLRLACRTIYDLVFNIDFREISPLVVTTVGGPLFRDVLSNIVGCIGMGIIASFKKDKFFSKFSRWYALIATGIMGSLTTFSSWNGEASIKFFAEYNVADGFFALLVGFSTSYMGLLFGMQIAKAIRSCLEYRPTNHQEDAPEHQETEEELHLATIDRSLLYSTWILLIACIIVFIALSSTLSAGSQRAVPLACIGGALGACARFFLSTKLNPKRPKFPIGTFLCNVLGSLSYISVYVSLRLRTSNLSIIDATSSLLMLGFTGGLSTVSSFMAELHSLNPASGWTYAVSTILTTQLLLLAFNGAFKLVTT